MILFVLSSVDQILISRSLDCQQYELCKAVDILTVQSATPHAQYLHIQQIIPLSLIHFLIELTH